MWACWFIDTKAKRRELRARGVFYRWQRSVRPVEAALRADIDESAWAELLLDREPGVPSSRDREDRSSR